MICPPTTCEHASVDAAPIIADAQTELAWIVSNFYFDIVAFGVNERIHDGFASKMVEAIQSCDPDTAFTILKDSGYDNARQAVGRRKEIHPSLVEMRQA